MEDAASGITTSQIASSLSSGTKRKRASEPKFYAVRAGSQPGVYSSWADCLKQVKGYKNALFKSFPSYTDAERYVAGENPMTGKHGLAQIKYYAVKNGRVPGIYTDWESARQQVTGWQQPKHRMFTTRSEAERYLQAAEGMAKADSTQHVTANNDFFNPNTLVQPSKVTKQTLTSREARMGNGKPRPRDVEYREADFEPGTGPLPSGSIDGFDPRIRLDSTGRIVYKTQGEREATKMMTTQIGPTEPIKIHTDGSSLGNGRVGAFAGIGVYFGPADKRNISEPLPGPKQTNQRAELTAIQRAVEHAPRNRNIIIITDSKYAIDCLTSWFINWRRNGWKNAAGKTVENKDLIESILQKIEGRERLRARTTFEWTKGHSVSEGNQQADRLAVAGARRGAEEEESMAAALSG